ncbi:hypothetical protein IU438_19740 [Nocardia cyriacigeorgica]|uniref:hypothetical protein n=1 Tax=Nocardia cyriacigeorgica TaxID=135487 RepID=UPI00131A135B|nr:hypothetical protein [Nocardia cyriacigeorgica]MBF6089164.1 hypothetical protein [Nocardia cyriacigeorgica]MBF6095779.1 hypothetical protein [Nocardia cyriacigeorgica]MBF6398025.1 hypothetical protein [Nocardia cyriacigeorgica]MBF6404461.1 hypothetical protein [Nocardia cyriacigeorgica]MBF6496127.1 hypothetical protein [Nocardia cyriacigeorgica]
MTTIALLATMMLALLIGIALGIHTARDEHRAGTLRGRYCRRRTRRRYWLTFA